MKNNEFKMGKAPGNNNYWKDYGLGFYELKTEGKGFHDSGWKFHLSTDAADTPRAWNIVVDELTKSGTGVHAKVVDAEHISKFSDPALAHGQEGKMITVYAPENMSPEQQMEMMRRIEARFKAEGIKSGLPVTGDRPVSGSDYMAYRNDRNPNGDYASAAGNIKASPEKAYNPHGFDDPYQKFELGPQKAPATLGIAGVGEKNPAQPLKENIKPPAESPPSVKKPAAGVKSDGKGGFAGVSNLDQIELGPNGPVVKPAPPSSPAAIKPSAPPPVTAAPAEPIPHEPGPGIENMHNVVRNPSGVPVSMEPVKPALPSAPVSGAQRQYKITVPDDLKGVSPAAPPPAVPAPHEPSIKTGGELPSVRQQFSKASGGIEGGMAVVGIVQGIQGISQSKQEHDKAGIVVNSANVLTGLTSLGITTAKTMGMKVLPGIETVAGHANVAVTIGTGVYQVATEKGNLIDSEADGSHNLGNKGERALAVAGTTGAGIGLAALGVSTAGVGIAVAGGAIVGEEAIKTRRAWKDTDHQFETDGRAHRLMNAQGKVQISDDSNRPDIRSFKHLMSETVKLSSDIDDKNITGKLERDKTGRILPTPANAKVMSDPKNLPELQKAIDKHEKEQSQKMADNDSKVPGWLRMTEAGSQKQTNYTLAKGEVLEARGAKQELEMYRREMAAYNASPQAAAFAKTQVEHTAAEAKAQHQAVTRNDIAAVQDKMGVGAGAKGKLDAATKDAIGEMIAKAQQSPEYKAAMESSGGKLTLDGTYGKQTALALKAMEARGEISPGTAEAIAKLNKDGGLQYTKIVPSVTVTAKPDPVPTYTVASSSDHLTFAPGTDPTAAGSKQQKGETPASTAARSQNPETLATPRTGSSYSSTIGDLPSTFNIFALTPLFQSAVLPPSAVVPIQEVGPRQPVQTNRNLAAAQP